LSIEYRKTNEWKEDSSQDENFLLGDEDDVIEDNNLQSFIENIFGLPIRDLFRVQTLEITVSKNYSIDIIVKKECEIG